MSLGLTGAHRVGKTSLAREVAAARGIPFIQTSTSSVIKKIGLDPSLPMTFDSRMKVQWAILEHYDEVFRGQDFFITDRTPIDLIGYTLADITGLIDADYAEIRRYMAECHSLGEKVFTRYVLIQPGIPLVHEEGKAPLNMAYIEHLNLLMLGALHNPEQKVLRGVMPREAIQMNRRVKAIIEVIDRIGAEAISAKQKARLH